MTLGEQQRLFVRLVSRLVDFAYGHGYEFSYGETKRSDEQAQINALGSTGREALAKRVASMWPALAAALRNNVGDGIVGSLHELGLAVDFNLFQNGVYLNKTEDHRPLGIYWETLHPLCCWGEAWGDGNHYSMTYGGKKEKLQ